VIQWQRDLAGAGEEKERCRVNDVSIVNCYKPGSKSPLRGGCWSLPRRKVVSSDHRLHSGSHKVSKKVHRRDQDQEQQLQRDQAVAETCDIDGNQPQTDY
uniref:Uncharacterized protein n=1 Tax=Oryza glaberrima TaxID=4538 RepID=I1PUZ7_ORYGL